MNDSVSNIMQPVIPFGFAGLSVLLLVILVWLIRELLGVLKENNRVIAINTQAIQAVDSHAVDALAISIENKNLLLSRPCIARFKSEEA